MDMCLGINGKCGACPFGDFCGNVYKYELCSKHIRPFNVDPNEELSDLFKNLNLKK